MAERPPVSEPQCGVCHVACRVPVMLSCWHPFCLGCIERVWCQVPGLDHGCPLCLEVQLPPSASSPGAVLPAVLCDFCLGERPAATKTCLTCLASFCDEHLQPHLSAEMFRGHRLAEPTCDLSARCCVEHGKALEMFCRDCRLCVCSMCPIVGRHQGHRVSLVDQEATEKRNQLKICLNRLSCKNKQENANINQIQKTADDLKVAARDCTSWLSQEFTAMRLLLDEEETAARELVEAQSQAALQVYDEQVQSCGERIQATNVFVRRLHGINKQDDGVQLVKEFTATESDMQVHQQPCDHIHPVPLNFDPLHSYISCFHKALKTLLKTPLEQRAKKGLTNGPDAKQVHTLLHKTKSTGDKLNYLRYARSPILDADTSHPRLRLSETGETVSKGWLKRSCSNGPQRFDRLLQVLARESYYAGRHYWEVDVRGAGQGWWVGVAYRSMARKGDTEDSRLGCSASSWCLKHYDLEYWAFHNSTREPVFPDEDPERLGVFLDYEAGTLSFYDALSGMQHLHTFHARFTEPLYPALRLWEGAISLCKLT